jgi:hypothetical protein
VVEEMKSEFEKRVVDFDRASLAEFEVLFDDAVSHLTNLLNSKIEILTEQENIRIEQIRLAEERKKQEEEAKKLAEIQRIQREEFEAEQKRVAEEQRIAQENFLKEKREFEEKQAEAKLNERIKQLADLGITEDVIWFGEEKRNWANLRHSAINEPDDIWSQTLVWAKEQITTPKPNESAKEDYHEADVDPKGVIQPQEAEVDLADYVITVWQNDNSVKVELNFLAEDFIKFSHLTVKEILQKEFNVPTRKN